MCEALAFVNIEAVPVEVMFRLTGRNGETWVFSKDDAITYVDILMQPASRYTSPLQLPALVAGAQQYDRNVQNEKLSKFNRKGESLRDAFYIAEITKVKEVWKYGVKLDKKCKGCAPFIWAFVFGL